MITFDGIVWPGGESPGPAMQFSIEAGSVEAVEEYLTNTYPDGYWEMEWTP